MSTGVVDLPAWYAARRQHHVLRFLRQSAGRVGRDRRRITAVGHELQAVIRAL